jgi:hypothetical protein
MKLQVTLLAAIGRAVHISKMPFSPEAWLTDLVANPNGSYQYVERGDT